MRGDGPPYVKLGRVHSLSRGRSGPVDEIACATVDERAVAKGVREVCKVFALNRGIMVHRNTSLYITMNEVEPRLGTNMHVHDDIYTVDDFPNYTKIHHQASPSIFVL